MHFQGVSAFWSATPDTSNGPVKMHWITSGGGHLVFYPGETRCILVGSGFGINDRMYAMLRPCDSKQASGLLTIAASAAPPPPPGSGAVRGYFDPTVAPPPPPGVVSAAWEIWKRAEVLPRTEALCVGGLEGQFHETLCLEMARSFASWQAVAGVGLRAPLCRARNCWRRCEASKTGADTDSFHTCKSLSCASARCIDFLMDTCPPVVHARLESIYNSACTIVPPSPPTPPNPPPSPPRPPSSPAPHPPPPFIGGSVRERDYEMGYDPDCEMVTFQQCRMKIKEYSDTHPGHLNAMRATIVACEGGASDQTCFQGCQFGGKSGGLFRFFLDDTPERVKMYNTKRCKHAMMPFCLCGNAAPPPPRTIPPPPPITYEEDWMTAGLRPSTSSERGRVVAFYKRAVLARMINPSLRASAHSVSCPTDDCIDKCARVCANHHLNDLRVVTVTGEAWVKEHPPPPPHPAPYPPPPDPPFLPFSSCRDSCSHGPLFDYEEGQCRDGGKGAFFPSLCSYSTSCMLCGIRPNSPTIDQDDSCPEHALNRVCEDGGTGSRFYRDDHDHPRHLCGYGTDRTDCAAFGERVVPTFTFESYFGATNVTVPTPPPSPPPPPYPLFPPPSTEWAATTSPEKRCYAFFEGKPNGTGSDELDFQCSGTKEQIDAKEDCLTFAQYNSQPDTFDYCSDGGLGSYVVQRKGHVYEQTRMACDYGSELAPLV